MLDVEDGYLFGKFAGPHHGLGLPAEVLEKIYAGNFERLAGKEPKRLDPGAITSECERLEMMLPLVGQMQPGMTVDTSVARQAKDFFSNLS